MSAERSSRSEEPCDTDIGINTFVLCARADGPFAGACDMDETMARLALYQEAGADLLYAPALMTLADIKTVIDSVQKPVNVPAGIGNEGNVAELAGQDTLVVGAMPAQVATEFAKNYPEPRATMTEVAEEALDAIEQAVEDVYPGACAEELLPTVVGDPKSIEEFMKGFLPINPAADPAARVQE